MNANSLYNCAVYANGVRGGGKDSIQMSAKLSLPLHYNTPMCASTHRKVCRPLDHFNLNDALILNQLMPHLCGGAQTLQPHDCRVCVGSVQTIFFSGDGTVRVRSLEYAC